MTRQLSENLRALEEQGQEQDISEAVEYLSSAYEAFLTRSGDSDTANGGDLTFGTRLRASVRQRLTGSS